MQEKDVQDAVLKALKLHPLVWRAWRNREAGARRGRARMNKDRVGSPDVEGILKDGRYLGIEVKLPDGKHKVSPGQLEWGQDVRRLGCCWFVARCVGDVFEGLARFSKGGEAWASVDTALAPDSGRIKVVAVCAPKAARGRATSRGKARASKPTGSARVKRPKRSGDDPTPKGSGRR
jgi:hypothetical protein